MTEFNQPDIGPYRQRFSQISTMMRLPHVEDVAGLDIAFVGVPFDMGIFFRPGARAGPSQIREMSRMLRNVHTASHVAPFKMCQVADAGDAPVKPYSCRETFEATRDFATGIGEPGHTKLLAVGGDHSIALANIAATWQRRGRPDAGLAVLHFDAHLDTVDEVWDEKWGHASPFLRAAEQKFIDPSRMLTVGIRGPGNDLADFDTAKRLGIDVVTFEQWRSGLAEARLDAFRERIGDDEVYLSFDIDCIDPAFAPGTGTPVCGGFSSADVLGLLRRFAGVNLAGADVVEVLPALDPTGVTSLLAAHVIFEILSLAAVRASA